MPGDINKGRSSGTCSINHTWLTHWGGHEASGREHCARIITLSLAQLHYLSLLHPTPNSWGSLDVSQTSKEPERRGEIKTWEWTLKKRSETEVGTWRQRWRSSARRMRSREETDEGEERIERVWRGKRQHWDLLMHNRGILSADSKHIPTACKY